MCYPSSVHEVLIVPDNGEMEPKMLGEMVREVNKNEVERQEVLSDRVYSYDKENTRFARNQILYRK